MRIAKWVAVLSVAAVASTVQPTMAEQRQPANQALPAMSVIDFNEIGDLNRDTYVPQAGEISNLIYVNRCIGNCVVTKGGDDAIANTTSIPEVADGTVITLTEFKHSDEVFNAIIECLREIYLPYDVEIVTEEPAAGVVHHEAVLAGTSVELMLSPNMDPDLVTLGIAPSVCRVRDNVMTFAFANSFAADPLQMCWAVAHESGHAFGLEHEYACEDPMTYLTDCGYRKFFRDDPLPCGDFNRFPTCLCGEANVQNTHQWMLDVFGPGQGARAPEVEVFRPRVAATVDDRYPIIVRASDIRGIDRVEYRINGTLWGTVTEAGPSGYTFVTPSSLSNGIQNIEVRAYNDLELVTAGTVQATKVAACTGNDDCGNNEECNEGACIVLPPTTAAGEQCTRDFDCLSGICTANNEVSLCTDSCNPFADKPCSDGFECQSTGARTGVCWPSSDGGCAVAGSRAARWTWLGLLGFAALLQLGRRRRFRR